ncbi:hypothetical protein LCGC14_0432490 [marine sediment metagenome]|uniref:Uncharacterized protein n=1 Tax=marine sediment metagenome TaxID=412755 RepID=A0A0F9SMH8_9ZZZZ
MTTIKLIDQLKKITDEWHDRFPEKTDENKKVLKLLKEFPFQKMIMACTERVSSRVKLQVLEQPKQDMLKNVKKIKDLQTEIILRQSSLFSQMGSMEIIISQLREKLKKLKKESNK